MEKNCYYYDYKVLKNFRNENLLRFFLRLIKSLDVYLSIFNICSLKK